MKSFKDYIDNTNEEELAKLEEGLRNSILGIQGNAQDHLANKIGTLRAKTESVEGVLEAEQYTREVLEQLQEYERPAAAQTETSAVEGYSAQELQHLAEQSSQAFAPKVSVAQIKQKSIEEELNRTVALDPRKVGAEPLLKDIEKSAMDSSQGIRDFYHHVYSKHGEDRLREKEEYLNLPLTGEIAKARQKLGQYANLNGFNTASLDTLNDGLISAMNDLHREELEQTPKGAAREALERRHAVEKALFDFREYSDKSGQAEDPRETQPRKDAYRELQKSHIAYTELRWGRPLAREDVPNVNDELEKFDLKAASPKQAKKATELQDYIAAKEIQRTKLGLKISKYR